MVFEFGDNTKYWIWPEIVDRQAVNGQVFHSRLPFCHTSVKLEAARKLLDYRRVK